MLMAISGPNHQAMRLWGILYPQFGEEEDNQRIPSHNDKVRYIMLNGLFTKSLNLQANAHCAAASFAQVKPLVAMHTIQKTQPITLFSEPSESPL